MNEPPESRIGIARNWDRLIIAFKVPHLALACRNRIARIVASPYDPRRRGYLRQRMRGIVN
jgi:hypothetical protein